jgi:ATP synthase protein I
LGVFFALAIEMSTATVGGVVVGYYLDKVFNTFPWLTGILFLGGIASGVNIAIYIVRRFKKIFT